jgi:hypothetical protein
VAGAGPSITGITPSQVVQGGTYHGVSIAGTGFAADDTVSFGDGVTASNLRATADALVVDIVVAPDAATGDRPVAVSGPGGNANGSCSGCFAVLASRVFSFPAYSGFSGGASVAAGDLDGQQGDEIVTGAGPGGGPHVIVWKVDPDTGAASIMAQFMAYDPRFSGGVSVAVGNVDRNTGGEIITGAGPGGGPNVVVWRLDGKGGATPIASFMAYAPGFTGGVNVAAGNVTGDSAAEIVTGPGPGGGPDVRVYGLDADNHPVQVAQFLAYGATFVGGVNVATSRGTILTGAGPSGGPHVRQFTVASAANAPAGFFAYDPGFKGGVHVTGGPATGQIAAGPGKGGGELRLEDASGHVLAALSPYGAGFTGGVNVALADIAGNGASEIVTAPQTGVVTIIGSRLV